MVRRQWIYQHIGDVSITIPGHPLDHSDPIVKRGLWRGDAHKITLIPMPLLLVSTPLAFLFSLGLGLCGDLLLMRLGFGL